MPNLYKRGETWWARFKVRGVEYRQSLRTTARSEAERRLSALRKDVEREALFGITPEQTWQAAVLAWNANAASDLAEATHKRYLASLKMLHPFLDGLHLRAVTIEKLREIIRGRKLQGAKTATIRRDLTAMSGVLDYAIGEGWIDENPTLTVRHKRMKERRLPITLPLEEEIALVKQGAPDRFADAMDFAREGGMREEEIFGLKRTQIGRDTITIRGKRGRIRVIPYTRRMRRIVERQPAYIGSPYVFWHSDGQRWKSPASRFGDIRRRVAQKAAHGFTGFRFHDLRHLYAVEYLQAGKGSIYDLQHLLGHESVKTTEIYLAFLTPEQKKAAMHTVAQYGAQEQRFSEEMA